MFPPERWPWCIQTSATNLRHLIYLHQVATQPNHRPNSNRGMQVHTPDRVRLHQQLPSPNPARRCIYPLKSLPRIFYNKGTRLTGQYTTCRPCCTHLLRLHYNIGLRTLSTIKCTTSRLANLFSRDRRVAFPMSLRTCGWMVITTSSR